MTYQQKLLDSITFAKKRMVDAESLGLGGERLTWSGYIQGIRYALAEFDAETNTETDHLLSTPANTERLLESINQDKKQCECSAQDFQPFGECQCGANNNL